MRKTPKRKLVSTKACAKLITQPPRLRLALRPRPQQDPGTAPASRPRLDREARKQLPLPPRLVGPLDNPWRKQSDRFVWLACCCPCPVLTHHPSGTFSPINSNVGPHTSVGVYPV